MSWIEAVFWTFAAVVFGVLIGGPAMWIGLFTLAPWLLVLIP